VSLVPLFPLPDVVLFPGVPLPLHVFEPRYRALVTDALASNRTVGMTLLKPGFEADYGGRPGIYPLGCAGTIVQDERLDDGRYNIVLHGGQRFRVLDEQAGGAYRVARVEALPEAPGDEGSVDRLRDEVLQALGRLAEGSTVIVEGDVPAAALVNALCQGLELPVVERLDLLACDSIESRAKRLVALLEFHRLEKTSGTSGPAN
jgi:Lon protease-like protein